MTLKQVGEFIKQHLLAVVSTAGEDGRPESALVEFGQLDDLSIVIDTFKDSRKYQNLQVNNKVAIVIGWQDDQTVQIDATAKELSGTQLAKAKEAYFAKNQRAKKWDNREDIAYFAFKPSWIRYSDVSKEPWVIKEFTL